MKINILNEENFSYFIINYWLVTSYARTFNKSSTFLTIQYQSKNATMLLNTPLQNYYLKTTIAYFCSYDFTLVVIQLVWPGLVWAWLQATCWIQFFSCVFFSSFRIAAKLLRVDFKTPCSLSHIIQKCQIMAQN